MARCTILLPPEIVEVPIVPGFKFWKSMVLEKTVVALAIHRDISVEFKAKCTIILHSTENHKLLRKCGSIQSKIIWPATIYRVTRLEGCIPSDVLRVNMARKLKICFVRKQNRLKLLISSCEDPMAESTPPGFICRFELMSTNRFILSYAKRTLK